MLSRTTIPKNKTVTMKCYINLNWMQVIFKYSSSSSQYSNLGRRKEFRINRHLDRMHREHCNNSLIHTEQMNMIPPSLWKMVPLANNRWVDPWQCRCPQTRSVCSRWDKLLQLLTNHRSCHPQTESMGETWAKCKAIALETTARILRAGGESSKNSLMDKL
jgi:hypothetical protein